MKIKKLDAPGDVSDVVAKPATVPAADPIAGLEKEAAALEGAAVQDGQAAADKQERQAVDTLQKDLADALAMAAAVAQPALWWLTPEQFAALWGKQVQAAIAVSGAELMRRHGLTMGDVMSKYGPYIGLAGALGPSTLATVAAFKREKQRQIEQQRAANGASNPAG